MFGLGKHTPAPGCPAVPGSGTVAASVVGTAGPPARRSPGRTGDHRHPCVSVSKADRADDPLTFHQRCATRVGVTVRTNGTRTWPGGGYGPRNGRSLTMYVAPSASRPAPLLPRPDAPSVFDDDTLSTGCSGRSRELLTVGGKEALLSYRVDAPNPTQSMKGNWVENQRRRPDPADLVVAGCGWLLIVTVVALPGLSLNDGPLTAYLVILGGVIGFLWARRRLRR